MDSEFNSLNGGTAHSPWFSQECITRAPPDGEPWLLGAGSSALTIASLQLPDVYPSYKVTTGDHG